MKNSHSETLLQTLLDIKPNNVCCEILSLYKKVGINAAQNILYSVATKNGYDYKNELFGPVKTTKIYRKTIRVEINFVSVTTGKRIKVEYEVNERRFKVYTFNR